VASYISTFKYCTSHPRGSFSHDNLGRSLTWRSGNCRSLPPRIPLLASSPPSLCLHIRPRQSWQESTLRYRSDTRRIPAMGDDHADSDHGRLAGCNPARNGDCGSSHVRFLDQTISDFPRGQELFENSCSDPEILWCRQEHIQAQGLWDKLHTRTSSAATAE